MEFSELLTKQSVVDGTDKLLSGNVATPYEFFHNYLSAEQQSEFIGSQQFADVVRARVYMVTGARLNSCWELDC